MGSPRERSERRGVDMRPKVLLFIIILAAVTAVLVFFAVRTTRKPVEEEPRPTGAVYTPAPKTTTVYFDPQSLDLTTTTASASSVDLVVDTSSDKISGVQVDLYFDPDVITDIAIIPPSDQESFLGTSAQYRVLINELNLEEGVLSYTVAHNPRVAPVTGIGKIGTVTFSVDRNVLQSSTQITFGERSSVSKIGVYDTVLKNTTPLTIKLR